MENGPFEDVSPIKCDSIHFYVSLPEGSNYTKKFIFLLMGRSAPNSLEIQGVLGVLYVATQAATPPPPPPPPSFSARGLCGREPLNESVRYISIIYPCHPMYIYIYTTSALGIPFYH